MKPLATLPSMRQSKKGVENGGGIAIAHRRSHTGGWCSLAVLAVFSQAQGDETTAHTEALALMLVATPIQVDCVS